MAEALLIRLVIYILRAAAIAGAALIHNHIAATNAAATRFYDFNVEYKNVSKLCRSATLVTVNGQYPGPTIYAQEGDRVIVKVTNSVKHNVTLHWHGVRQVLSCWFDGPAYITQCPIQPGRSFTYEFTLTRQKGTMLWHAHVNWLRATVHGPIVIFPKHGVPYPFPFPHAEHVIILGELWHEDADVIEARTLRSGGGPPNPDAFVINGHPGPLYPCSSHDMYRIMDVEPGRTYLLRLIGAALNDQHFFGIAGHNLTVVEADGEYTVPYTTPWVVITPGQTLNVLVTAHRHPPGHDPHDAAYNHTGSSSASAPSYYMGMAAYSSNANVPFLKTPALALWHYRYVNDDNHGDSDHHDANYMIHYPEFPLNNDTSFVTNFEQNIRSFSTVHNSIEVPRTVDRNLFFTIGLNEQKCNTTPDRDHDHTHTNASTVSPCQGPNGGRLSASMNNITFQLPPVSLLQAYHETNLKHPMAATKPSSLYYTTDFPDTPLVKYDYVHRAPNHPPNDTQSLMGTRLSVLDFGSNVQIVLQNTGTIAPESHPIHLHGFSFYVVASGFGNYNATDVHLNLHDPPLRNTVGVPAGGWTVIRFKADNPGVWHLHCHLEIHTTWGLSMAFIVKNGVGSDQTLPRPPADLPRC